MPLSNDPSAVQASVSSPPSYTDASPSERPREALEQFQLLLREFFGAKGHDHLSRHTMTPNPRINESRRGPVSSNSPYRGVTQHKKTRKWESHIWKSGKQLYCGAFDDAADAAKAHDIIGLRLKKTQASTNFLPACYERLLPMIDQLTEIDIIRCLRDCAHSTQDAQRKRLRLRSDEDRDEKVKREMADLKQAAKVLSAASLAARPFESVTSFEQGFFCPVEFSIQPCLCPTLPVQDWPPISRSEVAPIVATSSLSLYPPSLTGMHWEHTGRMHPCAPWLNEDMCILPPRQTQIPIFRGRVIGERYTHHLHPFLFEDASTSHPSSTQSRMDTRALSVENPLSTEPGDASNASCSDLKIQAVVQSMGLYDDEYEMQRQLDEILFGMEDDDDDDRDHPLL